MTECFRALQNETITTTPSNSRQRRASEYTPTTVAPWPPGTYLLCGLLLGILLGASGHLCYVILQSPFRIQCRSMPPFTTSGGAKSDGANKNDKNWT